MIGLAARAKLLSLAPSRRPLIIIKKMSLDTSDCLQAEEILAEEIPTCPDSAGAFQAEQILAEEILADSVEDHGAASGCVPQMVLQRKA
jgi:hypothetical protein